MNLLKPIVPNRLSSWRYVMVAGIITLTVAAGICLSTQAATYPSSFSQLSTPEFTSSGNQQVVLSGRVQPAAAGRPVSLHVVNSDGTSTWVQGTTVDANGYFSFTTTVNVITTFKFYSAKQVVGADTYQGVSSDNFTVKSLRFWDAFDYTSYSEMQSKWYLRGPTTYPPDGSVHTISSWDGISFNGAGKMIMALVEDGVGPDGLARFKVPHISAGTIGGIVLGHLEARIKFHRPKGAHGALWWQSGYAPGGGEFDVVEFFGERSSASQKVQHTVHQTLSFSSCGTSWTSGGLLANCPAFTTDNLFTGSDGTWWDSYHIFQGLWNTDKYYFYIDDILVGSIGSAQGITPATTPGEVILSLLVTEWEHDDLVAHLGGGWSLDDYKMHVDWIRVWR